MTTLLNATQLVSAAANQGVYLSEDLRNAMRITVQAAKDVLADEQYQRDTTPLKNLIIHMMIHTSYPRNGYDKMTSDERELYDAIVAEMGSEEGA
ncbi:hypothetical protein [Shewanella marisflavi]|uniref:hypothetical protein n=1 Tax=Shewanella marisflavi TaxID=260364 RepID=UPI003AB0A42E